MLHQAELLGLALQLRLVGAGAGDQEARPGGLLDHPRHRLERELEALLVDEPADQQDQLLVGLGELRAQPPQLGGVLGLEVVGVDPVGDHGHPLLLDAEDVGDLLAHVVGAGDHPLRAVGDPALDAVDVGLGVLVDPALVAAVLGRVDRRHQRRIEALGEVVAGVGDQPVVAVDEVEVEAVAELDPGGEHVRVHPLDPGDELAEVGRPLRLADAVDPDPAAALLRRRLLAPAGQHVDLDAVLDQRLGELADVACEAALDQRRVLPGEDQDAGHPVRARAPAGERDSGPGQASAYAGRYWPGSLWPRASLRRGRSPAGRRSRPPRRGRRGRPSRSPGPRAARARRAPRGFPGRPLASAPQQAQLEPPRRPGDVGDRRRVPGAEVLALAPGRGAQRPRPRASCSCQRPRDA